MTLAVIDILGIGTATGINNSEKETRLALHEASKTDCSITLKIEPLIKSC